jgi:hypothetical protein
MENFDTLVHFKIQQQAEQRLTRAGFLGEFWLGDELPVNTFRKLSGLDVLMIGSDPSYQFDPDKPEQGMKAIVMIEPLFEELTTGLGEVATGFATGVAVLNLDTRHPDFPFDATRYNSAQFPFTLSYLVDLAIRTKQNREALTFLGLSQQSQAGGIMNEVLKRVTYEYLRNVNIEETAEPDELSLNKLLRILEGGISVDLLDMYPYLKPVQKSMAAYSFRTAYNFAAQNKEKPADMTIGAPAAKSVNAKTGEITDYLPSTPEQKAVILENLFLKLTGSRIIRNAELIYALIAKTGLTNETKLPEEDFNTLVEEVTQTHEEVHKLARSVGPAFIYEGKVVNLIKLGFIIAPADMDFSRK